MNAIIPSKFTLILKKFQGKKQAVFLSIVVLSITLIQSVQVNTEYHNQLVGGFVIIGNAIVNMLYSFILVSENVCIREKKSGRVLWFLANGINPYKIILTMSKYECIAMALTECTYLIAIVLLNRFKLIENCWISRSIIIAILMINVIFYEFAKLMNALFLVTRKPENIKIILLLGFTVMFFIIYIPAYILLSKDITSIRILFPIVVGCVVLFIIWAFRFLILHNRFKERVTFSFKE